jgi:hypothetical protein
LVLVSHVSPTSIRLFARVNTHHCCIGLGTVARGCFASKHRHKHWLASLTHAAPILNVCPRSRLHIGFQPFDIPHTRLLILAAADRKTPSQATTRPTFVTQIERTSSHWDCLDLWRCKDGKGATGYKETSGLLRLATVRNCFLCYFLPVWSILFIFVCCCDGLSCPARWRNRFGGDLAAGVVWMTSRCAR